MATRNDLWHQAMFWIKDDSAMNQESTQAPGEPDLSVLLIDDDVELCELMREYLTARRPSEVEAIHDGRRGLSQAFGGAFDLIRLDVMLPGRDGLELPKQNRHAAGADHSSDRPHSRGSFARIAGLDAGQATITFPNHLIPKRLTPRMRAVLRRVA